MNKLLTLFKATAIIPLLLNSPLNHHKEKKTKKVDPIASLSRQQRNLLVDAFCKPYHTPQVVDEIIVYSLYDNPLEYKNKKLPKDLSGRDLEGFNFTGCHFTDTVLVNTNLTNTILIDTTCNYQKAFNIALMKRKSHLGEDPIREAAIAHLGDKDLKSIAKIYPKLSSKEKVQLLHIASNLTLLPSYRNNIEIMTKGVYWSCLLIMFKQELSLENQIKLKCALESFLMLLKARGWETLYPQEKVNINIAPIGSQWQPFLSSFQQGFKCYVSQDKSLDSNWYKIKITQSIEGLVKAYPKIKNKQSKKEAYNILLGLSKSYQVGDWELVHHFFLYQIHLIKLKKLITSQASRDIHLIDPFE